MPFLLLCVIAARSAAGAVCGLGGASCHPPFILACLDELLEELDVALSACVELHVCRNRRSSQVDHARYRLR